MAGQCKKSRVCQGSSEARQRPSTGQAAPPAVRTTGATAHQLQRCMDACEQHHAPRSRLAMGLEVELMRQAALVDSTAGIVNFGLNRRWLRALFRDVSRERFGA